MKKGLLILLVLGLLPFYASAYIGTPHSIAFTGTPSSDFYANEKIFSDSSSDSAWGSGNELYNLYLTWDNDSLYLAVDGVLGGGNTYDIWFAADKGSSCTSDDAITWGKKVGFSDPFHPDFVVHYSGGWSSFFQITNNSTASELKNTGNGLVINNGNGNFEVALPWSSIGLQATQKIKIASTITGGNYDACDAMPNQNPQPAGNGSEDILNYWEELTVTDASSVLINSAEPALISSLVPVELSDFQTE